MAKTTVNFSNEKKFRLSYVQFSHTEAVITLSNGQDKVEIELNEQQLKDLKDLLVDKEITP